MGLKECPSCQSKIEAAAVLCPLCGHQNQPQGQAGQASRTGGGRASGPGPEVPKLALEIDPLTLLPLLLFRLLLTAGCLFALVLAVAASPLGPVTRFVRDHGVGARTGAPILWAAVAGFLLLILAAGSMIRRLRLKRTFIHGQPVKVRLGIGPLIVNMLVALFIGPLTAGIALPWLLARFRQSFYRACVVTLRNGDRNLGFQGRGEEVLARVGLSILLLPLGVASGGLLLGLVSWLWVKWEQSNLVVPDRAGNYRTVDFFGSFWAYQARWIGGWFLTLLTAGIYRPWAKVSEWKWVVAHTQMP